MTNKQTINKSIDVKVVQRLFGKDIDDTLDRIDRINRINRSDYRYQISIYYYVSSASDSNQKEKKN